MRNEYCSWRSKDSENDAQIDLLIERADRVINLCEIKYSTTPYTIDKTEDMKFRIPKVTLLLKPKQNMQYFQQSFLLMAFIPTPIRAISKQKSRWMICSYKGISSDLHFIICGIVLDKQTVGVPELYFISIFGRGGVIVGLG